MSKSCLNCSTQSADDARFCAHCGTAFAAAPPADGGRIAGIVCPECHHANRASAQFCAQCGTDLSEQTVIAPVRREAPAVPAATAASSSVVQPSAPPAAEPFGRPPSSRHASLWIAFVVCVLVLIAAASWRFVGPPPAPRAGHEA